MRTVHLLYSALALVLSALLLPSGPFLPNVRSDLLGLWANASHSTDGIIVVDTTNDELSGSGRCSLRAAIQAANTDEAVGGCIAGDGEDTILVSAGIYTLTQTAYQDTCTQDPANCELPDDERYTRLLDDENQEGDLDINSSLTIRGSADGVTVINGDRIDRVLHILAGAVVEIEYIQVRNGRGVWIHEKPAPDPNYAGGGILNEGHLTLRFVTVANNLARPSEAGEYGDLDCPYPGADGGGIANQGTLFIYNTTIAHNEAGVGCFGLLGSGGGQGGGISNAGELTLVNSTLSHNRAGYSGAAFCDNGADGGGIHNTGTISVTNSTVTANMPSSAVLSIHCFPPLNPGEPPRDGRGGGIYNAESSSASVQIKNTIIGGNGFDDCAGGQLNSHGFNLITSLECQIDDTSMDIIGLQPLLAPLDDYGGPTLSHGLFASSPAVDAGSCTGIDLQPVTIDQRAIVRPQIHDCDIGAYETTIPDPFSYIYLPMVQ